MSQAEGLAWTPLEVAAHEQNSVLFIFVYMYTWNVSCMYWVLDQTEQLVCSSLTFKVQIPRKKSCLNEPSFRSSYIHSYMYTCVGAESHQCLVHDACHVAIYHGSIVPGVPSSSSSPLLLVLLRACTG